MLQYITVHFSGILYFYMFDFSLGNIYNDCRCLGNFTPKNGRVAQGRGGLTHDCNANQMQLHSQVSHVYFGFQTPPT